MFTRKENIEYIQLNESDCMDDYYSHNFVAEKVFQVNPKNKTGCFYFISCYIKGTIRYYKKSDIEELIKWKSQLALTNNLSPILQLKSQSQIIRFLDNYKFRIVKNDQHPFRQGAYFYLEDLNKIKEKRIQDNEQTHEHRRTLYRKSPTANKTVKSQSIFNKLGIKEYNYLEVVDEEIYCSYDIATKNLLNISNFCGKSLCKLINIYSDGVQIYFKRDDINKFIDLKKNTAPIKELSEIAKKSGTILARDLIEKGVNIIYYNEHPFGREHLYYKKDKERISALYNMNGLNNRLKASNTVMLNDVDLSQYISVKETEDLLGVKVITNRIEKYTTKYAMEGKVYFKREDIEAYLECKNSTIPIITLAKEFSKKGMMGKRGKALRNLIKENNITIIPREKYPFGNGDLVYLKDVDKIQELVDLRDKVLNEMDRYEKYRLLISEVKTDNILISKTIKDFNEGFIYSRFKTRNDKSLPYTLANTYKIIINTLKRNVLDYDSHDMDRIIVHIYNSSEYPYDCKQEFVFFYNYLIDKYNIIDKQKYKIDMSRLVKSPRDSKVYTKVQLICLFGLIYKSLDNRTVLIKAINHRAKAMGWLYIYLHFVTLWRKSSIMDIRKPDLSVIGFTDGESFIDWLRNPSNIFTIEMGVKICDSVKRKIESLDDRAHKNNQPLVFEAGRLLSRGGGLLLALCEAHRQIAERANLLKKSKFSLKKTDVLITTSVVTNPIYSDLFGKEFLEIIPEGNFSNRKADKAFNNYTIDFSEENGDGLGGHMLSIMRGHIVNIRGVSNTTPIYETRITEGTIGEIERTLFERGCFGFAKYKLLGLCDKKFLKEDSKTKTELINKLTIRPLEAEQLVKGIFEQRKVVLNLILKMNLSEPEQIKSIISEIAFGHTAGKHSYTRCLLKAILNSNTSNEAKEYALNALENYRYSKNCLMPESDSCCGCSMLIGEMYFLYELNDIILDTITALENCESKYESYMYSNILFKSYLPILYEAQEVLGEEIIDIYINMEDMVRRFDVLENKNKILLKLEGGNI